MLKQVNGKWALVSKKTQRPLAYYKGQGKPSDAWVAKQERRIQFFKESITSPDILPKSGGGNDGTTELVKTYMKDTPGQDFKKFKAYIKSKY